MYRLPKKGPTQKQLLGVQIVPVLVQKLY